MFELLEDRRLLAVAFDLLKDINLENTTSSNPQYLVEMGGLVYFAAKTTETGIELWKSDGTAAGTTLVKDIHPGPADSRPVALTNYNGTLYFIAWDGVHGEELWHSDGTEAGTYLVKDINEGPASSGVTLLSDVGGMLYFRANDDDHGYEPWVSDGTVEGTKLLKNFNPGPDSSSFGYFTEFGDRVFLAVNERNTSEGSRVWTTDGTPEGTSPFVVDFQENSNPRDFVNVGGSLFYTTDYGLVATDGTTEGTTLVKAFSQRPYGLVSFDDTLFFRGYESATGYELWTSDGSESGTTLLKDIQSGTTSADIGTLREFEGTIYFSVESSSTYYLWTTDGTESSTVPILNFGVRRIPSGPMRVGEKILIVVNGDLWETDFSPTGTALFKDLTVGDSFTGIGSLLLVDGVLYFSADDGQFGRELWRSDGTIAGTQLVADLHAETVSSSPFNIFELNGELYFLVMNGALQEFWKSDGTSAGTQRVRDLAQGDTNGHALSLAVLGNQLLLTVKKGGSGENLWTSDGTEEGTALLKVLRDPAQGGLAFGRPAFFTEAGGLLYFRGLKANDDPSFLWRTDGTEAGTFTVNDLDNGAELLYPRSMTEVGDLVMFRGDDGIHGFELWRSDGTNAGTYLVKDINPGSASSANTSTSDIPGTPPMTAMGGLLYFFANDGSSGFELWRSDGTADGTHRVKDIRPGAEGSRTSIRGDSVHTFAVGNTLYFSASDGEHGFELWRSGGTAESTVMVADLYEGSTSSLPGSFREVNGTFYFTANDGISGPQIWKIEPGAVAPQQVTNINPNPSGTSSPAGLTNINGTLYFSADDGIRGRELWRTDGTPAGTEFVYDFTGDAMSGGPGRIGELNGRLTLSVATQPYGQELWVADFAATGDFNLDGDVDNEDYAAWRSAFGSTIHLAADANRNGVVDAADYTIWRDHYFAPPALALLGDYNDDGVVDTADYTIWRDTLGGSVTPYLGADGSGNGVVDQADYEVWKANFGAVAAGSGSAALASTSPVQSITDELPALAESIAPSASLLGKPVEDAAPLHYSPTVTVVHRARSHSNGLRSGKRELPVTAAWHDQALVAWLAARPIGPRRDLSEACFHGRPSGPDRPDTPGQLDVALDLAFESLTI